MRATYATILLAACLLSSVACGGADNDAEARRLARELREGSSEQRQAATVALREMGERGFAALRPLLSDSDPRVRARAAFVWKHYADTSVRHVEIAAQMLQDESWLVRRAATGVLGRAAPVRDEALEALLQATVSEPHATVLEQLADALGNTPKAYVPESVPRLTLMASHGAPSVRAAAIRSLGRIGAGQPRAVETVRSAVERDQSVLVRVRAAAAHWRLTGEREPALTLLRGGLLSQRERVPEAALEGLRAMGAAAEPAVPALVELLDDQTLRVRAAETLGALGPVAEAALPRLLRAQEDPSSWFRQAAERAVRSIRGS